MTIGPDGKTRRGTSNGNQRGSSYERRRRREWLVETYRANVDVILQTDPRFPEFSGLVTVIVPFGHGRPACRCYRCGCLLTVDTVTVDRIIPGCHGGTYRRNNIRPACQKCNSETGAPLRRKKK